MDAPGARPETLLQWMLRVAPLAGVVGFGVTLVVSALTGIIATHTWFLELNASLRDIQKSEMEEHDAIHDLQRAMVDVDKRINAVVAAAAAVSAAREAEIMRLHNESDAADAQLKARLDVLDERSKFSADRAIGPPLPAPYRTPGR